MISAESRYCVVDRPTGTVVPPQSDPCEGLPLRRGMEAMWRDVSPQGELRRLIPPCGAPDVTGLEKLVFNSVGTPDAHTVYLLSNGSDVHTAVVLDTLDHPHPYHAPNRETLAVTVVQFGTDGFMSMSSYNGHGLKHSRVSRGGPEVIRQRAAQGGSPTKRFTFS